MDDEVVERPGLRGIPRWALVGSGLLVGVMLLGMLTVMPILGRPNYDVGLYDAWRPGAAVKVHGQPWPTGATARLPDVRMVAVGRTDDGHLLYADTHKPMGGGGGGKPTITSDLRAYAALWVRTGTSAYVRIDRP